MAVTGVRSGEHWTGRHNNMKYRVESVDLKAGKLDYTVINKDGSDGQPGISTLNAWVQHWISPFEPTPVLEGEIWYGNSDRQRWEVVAVENDSHLSVRRVYADATYGPVHSRLTITGFLRGWSREKPKPKSEVAKEESVRIGQTWRHIKKLDKPRSVYRVVHRFDG